MGGPGVRLILATVTVAIGVAACTASEAPSAEPTLSPGTASNGDTSNGDVTVPPASEVTVADDGLVTVPPVPTTSSTSSTTTTTVPSIPTPASAVIDRLERRYMWPDPLGPLSLAYGVPPVLLPPGEHVTDVLGVELTLNLDRWWRLDAEQPGRVALTRVENPLDAKNPVVLFERPVGLAAPEAVADPNALPGDHPVAPDELAAWLDDVPQIDVVATGEAMAGDTLGRWYDIDVDPAGGPVLDDCLPRRCVRAWWSGGTAGIVARDEESVRYYDFPFADGPVYALVAAEYDERNDWIDLADDLIRSTTFGPSAPHPVPSGYSVGLVRGHEPDREWRFIAMPGIVITPKDYSISNQRPGMLLFEPWGPSSNDGNVSYVCPLQDSDGRPMRSLDDVAAELAAAGLRREDDVTIFETTAVVYEGVVELAVPIFRRTALIDDDHPARLASWPDSSGRDDQMFLRVWAFESPIGPLLLVAESGTELFVDAVIEGWAMDLVEMTRFERSLDSCGSEST